MKNIIEIDMLKKELKETQKMYLEVLNIIDKIKIKLISEDKVSKKEILNLINKEEENEKRFNI